MDKSSSEAYFIRFNSEDTTSDAAQDLLSSMLAEVVRKEARLDSLTDESW